MSLCWKPWIIEEGINANIRLLSVTFHYCKAHHAHAQLWIRRPCHPGRCSDHTEPHCTAAATPAGPCIFHKPVVSTALSYPTKELWVTKPQALPKKKQSKGRTESQEEGRSTNIHWSLQKSLWWWQPWSWRAEFCNGTGISWARGRVALQVSDIGCKEEHAELTSRQVEWACHLLLVEPLPVDSLFSHLLDRGAVYQHPSLANACVPLLPAGCLTGWGHQTASTTEVGLPQLADNRSHAAVPWPTARPWRMHKPCSSVPAVHLASNSTSRSGWNIHNYLTVQRPQLH